MDEGKKRKGKLRFEGFHSLVNMSVDILILVICRLCNYGLAESLQCFRSNTDSNGGCATHCANNSQDHSHS